MESLVVNVDRHFDATAPSQIADQSSVMDVEAKPAGGTGGDRMDDPAGIFLGEFHDDRVIAPFQFRELAFVVNQMRAFI